MAVMRGLALLFLVLFVENVAARDNPCSTPPKPPTRRMYTMTTSMKPVPRACPLGWIPFETQCYRFFPQTVNWATAEKICQANGANLASVHTKARNDFLLRLVPFNSLAWIGGHDGEVEREWLWSDGSRFTYTNWCVTEPNNLGVENCMEINWTGSRCWNDAPCYAGKGFICAQKL